MFKNLNPLRIRAILTGATGLGVALGVLSEDVSALIVDNAEAAFGSVLVLWSIFTELRAREKKALTGK